MLFAICMPVIHKRASIGLKDTFSIFAAIFCKVNN